LITLTRDPPHSDGVVALRGLTRGVPHSDGIDALSRLARVAPHSRGGDALRGHTRSVPHSDRKGTLSRRTRVETDTHLPITIIRFDENFTTHQNITRDFNITRKCLDIRRRHMLLL
jgi:hypothetical protein